MERLIATGVDVLPYILVKAEGADSLPERAWEELAVLLGTRPEEQALDRDLGINIPIDGLVPQAMAETEAELTMKVRKYIEGVYVVALDWGMDGYGGSATLEVTVGYG